MVKAVEPQSTAVELPPYILLEVFQYLSGRDLTACTGVSHMWRSLIHTRRQLRSNAFLPPLPSSEIPSSPPAQPAKISDVELHPVLSLLHFDPSLDAAAVTYGTGTRGREVRLISDGNLGDMMATAPPVEELRLDVLKYHPNLVVRREGGVKVADVVQELINYKESTTDFTFEEFFQREICSQRGYDRRRRMRRVDMVGADKVLVTFSPAMLPPVSALNTSCSPHPPSSTVLFKALAFHAVKDVQKHYNSQPEQEQEGGARPPLNWSKDVPGYRFWSAFAFGK